MIYGKIQFDSLKNLLALQCLLSIDEINRLEKECFDFATTTVRPNHEVTYLLMEKAYKMLSTGQTTYTQMMSNFQYWMMMPL